ncbi:MAG: outer membrane lipoprotein chaperone LolA [Xanthomonadales bacterium]|nr:outer membrane lipoprotein chaperone LolA [Xanthomonadales bacterium]
MRGILLLLGALLAFGVRASTPASTASPIEAFSTGLVSLQGEFAQQVYDANDRLREESRGTVALAVPRQFRWDYQQPFEQTIVADGSRIWIYDPDLEQVTVRQRSEDEASSPLMVLVDPKLLDERFSLTEEPLQDGVAWFRLAPRNPEDAGFEAARLGLRDGELVEIELRDQLGQRTLMHFSAWRRNAPMRDGLFRFAPPAGADVVGDVESTAVAVPLQD